MLNVYAPLKISPFFFFEIFFWLFLLKFLIPYIFCLFGIFFDFPAEKNNWKFLGRFKVFFWRGGDSIENLSLPAPRTSSDSGTVLAILKISKTNRLKLGPTFWFKKSETCAVGLPQRIQKNFAVQDYPSAFDHTMLRLIGWLVNFRCKKISQSTNQPKHLMDYCSAFEHMVLRLIGWLTNFLTAEINQSTHQPKHRIVKCWTVVWNLEILFWVQCWSPTPQVLFFWELIWVRVSVDLLWEFSDFNVTDRSPVRVFEDPKKKQIGFHFYFFKIK